MRVDVEAIVDLDVRYDNGLKDKDHRIMHGRLHLLGHRQRATVPDEVITVKKYSGDQVWAWAQANWDKFMPETMSVPLSPDMEVEGSVRWVCVVGVYNTKNGAHLPMAELSSQNASYRSYGNHLKKREGMKTDNRKVKVVEDTPPKKTKKKTTTTTKQSTKAKKTNKALELAESGAQQDRVKTAIEKAMKEDESE